MSGRALVHHSSDDFLVFTTDEALGIEVRYDEQTIWLSQKLMAQLFGVDVRTVNEHLKNIYDTGELVKRATIRKFRIVQQEGGRQISRNVDHYNLDAIISVGYRVNSLRATQFRQWATRVVRDFTLRGYVLDKERMEAGGIFGEDYFEELLEQIREIRLSERRFYQKVTDIYATASDYSQDAVVTKRFFATVQNKLHYAVHGRTAAELIRERADSSKPHMGLTSWSAGPDGKVLKRDVTVAKNYLTESELKDLGRLVETYLNLAQSRAERHIPTTMEQWVQFLDQVLNLDERETLEGAGGMRKSQADAHAKREYEQFRVIQDRTFVSDFDRFSEEAADAERGRGANPV